MILGLDDAVGGTALTRDIAARDPGQYVASGIEDSVEDGGRSLQVDEFSCGSELKLVILLLYFWV